MISQTVALLFLFGLAFGGNVQLQATPAPETEGNSLESEEYKKIVDTLRDRIITQFEVVETKLEELTSGPARIKRSLPVKNDTKCTISEKQLIGLKDRIEDIMSNVSSTVGACQVTESDNNCQKWLKLIQCGVQELGEGFKKANSSASIEEIEKWKNAYNSLLSQYTKEIDNLKASLSQEYQKKMDELNTAMQNLAAIITKTELELKNTLIRLCASFIGNGKIDDALKTYERINDMTKLKEITKLSYTDFGKRKNVGNIVSFVKKLPTCDYDNVAYPGVYEGMKADNQLVKPEVVTLFEAVKPCMCSSDLKKDLEKYAK